MRHSPGELLSGFIEGGPTLLVAASAALCHMALYGLANRFPSGPPTMLPQSWLDRAVPLWPWTAWIYASAHLMVLAAFWQVRSPGARTRFAIAFMVTIALSVLVHWGWPVRFPRELFPLGGGGAGEALLDWLRGVDHAGSAFPSLHVAMVALAALQVARERRRSAPAMALWAAAVAISTLTTKQHYAVDVAAGVVLAVAVDWAVVSLTSQRRRRAWA